ncbi:hypothetical protein [Puniceicoccus vermicola]|uniref:Uncharacterized protein n=1 Tax=Puniceicoccus vermicola TaxID=388746 RepID=A0A7X1E5P0_9BACT|nr:hypothetical protein [Puniceicoccus vermicola]MBC2601792.1 hypothetical protein [Puniceicoccus vermicola]
MKSKSPFLSSAVRDPKADLRARIRRRVTELFFLLLVLASPLAQGEPPQVSATLQILLHRHIPPVRYERGEEVPEKYQPHTYELYYRTQNEFHPIQFDRNAISDPIQYQGPINFTLYRRIPAQGPDQEDQYVPQLQSQLTPGLNQTQFLLGQDNPDQATHQLVAIPIDFDNIPPNTIYGFNMGSIPLKVATSDQKLTIGPGRGAKIELPSGSSVPYQILAAIDDDDTYRLVYRRRWPTGNGYRALCIFFPTNETMTRWNSRLIPIPEGE